MTKRTENTKVTSKKGNTYNVSYYLQDEINFLTKILGKRRKSALNPTAPCPPKLTLLRNYREALDNRGKFDLIDKEELVMFVEDLIDDELDKEARRV